ncbi:MAG: hypothetical protein OXF52_02115 [Candidatus Dadabacteria bacterium]|nr:hypothetical protein [Candidatus Dadabacteria bacterium]
MKQEEKYIGYLRYSGKPVKDGILGARKSAEVLIGFDKILRHFLLKEDPKLKNFDFEIPVKIQKGSWEMCIPEAVDIFFVGKTLATIYGAETVRQAAKDGVLETGLAKDIRKTFRATLKSIQWIIRAIKHNEGFITKNQLKHCYVEQTQEGTLMIFKNKKGDILKVPEQYRHLIATCPKGLFSQNAKIIQEDTKMEIGIYGEEEKTFISNKEKHIFFKRRDTNRSISETTISKPHALLEFKDEEPVELEGEVIKVTKSEVQILYKESKISCKPKSGSLAEFRNSLISQEEGYTFSRVKIEGMIKRYSGSRELTNPQIIFSDITSLPRPG